MDKRSLDRVAPLHIAIFIIILITFFVVDQRTSKDMKAPSTLLYLTPFALLAFLENTRASKWHLALIYYFTVVCVYLGVCYLTIFFGGSKILFKILPILCAVPGLIWYSSVINKATEEDFEEESETLQITATVTESEKRNYQQLLKNIEMAVQQPHLKDLRSKIWSEVHAKTNDAERAKQTCIGYYLSTKRDLINDLSELRHLKSDIKADLQYLIDMNFLQASYPHGYKEKFLGKS